MTTLQEVRKEMESNGHEPTRPDKASVEGFTIIHCLRCHRHVIILAKGVMGADRGRVLGVLKSRCKAMEGRA